jgi:NADH-quinone oxidoreductase subunit K
MLYLALQAASEDLVTNGMAPLIQAVEFLSRQWFATSGERPMSWFVNVDYHQYFVLSSFIFCLGLYGVIARRNAIGMLLALELMLNAVNINMSAFNAHYGPKKTKASFTTEDSVLTNMGQVFSIFTIIVAAAEAAIGLAIIIAYYRLKKSIMLDSADLMKD